MAKPTVLQSLLGRPSQTYSFPREKDYHSSKQRMSWIAAQIDEETSKPLSHELLKPVTDNNDADDSSSDSDEDVFYTPLSSPRTSLVAASAPHLPLASSSTTSLDSTLATVSVDERHSLFSSPPRSESTPATTPVSSETGHYAKEAWAKDVRWLVPPSTAAPTTSTGVKKTHTKSRSEASASASTSSSSSSSNPSRPPARRRRSRSLTSRSTTYKTAETSTPYVETLSAQHLPSTGTAGYTSLVLPRAPPSTSSVVADPSALIANTKVDLTKTGMAHTTMASVEIVGGLSTTSRSLSWMSKFTKRKKPSGQVSLGFTQHLTPPNNVPAQSVLIQVWAVGLDGVDAVLCRTAQVGYVPGRSVVGRVVEVGWEVDEDTIRRGEWAVALADIRTAGGLTEFIVVDRHRICRVYHPNMTVPRIYSGLEQVHEEESETETTAPHSDSAHDGRYPHPRRAMSARRPSKPPKSRSASSSVQRRDFGLSLEELALLALCGVPAYRASRTFAFNAGEGRHRKRALVLNGNIGTGAVAAQILCKRGWRVCIHAHMPSDDSGEELLIRNNAQTWGAEEVIFGDALETIELCTRQKDVFEGVLDTVGGKPIREAAYKLLARSRGRGSFTTVVGDHPDRVIPSAADHYRSAHRGRDEKVAYAWTSVAQDVDWEGQDIAETLACVLREGVRPIVGTDAMMGLDRVESDKLMSLLHAGRTAIVKVAA